MASAPNLNGTSCRISCIKRMSSKRERNPSKPSIIRCFIHQTPPEFQLDSPVSPSPVASPSPPAPASPWALGPSVERRQLAIALAAVWGVRLAADAAERGALDALVLNVRLDALVHLVLDVLAVALLYEARR